MSSVFGTVTRKSKSLSDIGHSCLIFNMFNLSALTHFNNFSVLFVADAPLFCGASF